MENDYLAQILERKKEEVEAIAFPKSLKEVLKGEQLTVIAEIKRRSPSKGALAEIADPLELAKKYAAAGASAFSVLTDGKDFGGSLKDLRQVAEAFPHMPLLRKDFLIDEKQLRESLRAGASAVLLIVKALGEKLPRMLCAAEELGLDVLVEVHDLDELQRAIASGAKIIGVNSRNLSTFQIDLKIAEQLAKHIPPQCISIAESGIATVSDAKRMRQAGYHAVLVGEALVKSEHPQKLIEEFRQCSR